MNLLFVHQNSPGQFKHLAPHLASLPGNQVVFITRPGKPDLPGIHKIEYVPRRNPSERTHRYLRLVEEGVLNGQAVARAAVRLSKEGFAPDVIVAHMGWGEALYLKKIWPRARLLGYFEWYYRSHGSDVGFLEQTPPSLDIACGIETRNGLHLLGLQMMDWGISPTKWQWQQHPEVYLRRISVIHDGVDTDRVKPDSEVTGSLQNGLRFKAGDELVTYVARNLEPYRGFHVFMRAAEIILKRRPNTHILVIGADGVSYGQKPKNGSSHREVMLDEVDLDLERVHFLGRVDYDLFLRVLQLSAAHVYLSVPFVLSWSMLEAMSAGCLVIGSRTPPVQEVISDGSNGLLVDFFSPREVADAVDRALDHPDRMAALRAAARRTVEQRYALKSCLTKQVELVGYLARQAHT
ncbi:MAG: glycosyltransferase family 4 protein [Gammaproteobacteria bacterium]|nr:glycosyltransferase family 4 protein [Gammaproteobacteria bacterium]